MSKRIAANFTWIVSLEWHLAIPGSGGRAAPLTKAEALVFMDKLAKLEVAGATDGPIKVAWEDAFLDALHHLCSTPDPPLAEVAPSDLPAALGAMLLPTSGHRNQLIQGRPLRMSRRLTPVKHHCIRLTRPLMLWHGRVSRQLSVQLRNGRQWAIAVSLALAAPWCSRTDPRALICLQQRPARIPVTRPVWCSCRHLLLLLPAATDWATSRAA